MDKTELEPNIGLKKKKRATTYIGPDASLNLPAVVPKDIRDKRAKIEQAALDRISGHINDAIDFLVWGIEQKEQDKWLAYNCACTLLKKALPDRRSATGKGEDKPKKQIINNYIDRRGEVNNILQVLDKFGFAELKERAENGSVGLLEADSGAEISPEEEIFGIEEDGEGPGSGEGEGPGSKGPLSSEAVPSGE